MTEKKTHVLLGVSGSVAAVKSPDVVRRLQEKGFHVSCVMTPSATHFVSELVLSSFTAQPVISNMFGPEAYKMPHLSLAEDADILVIAPASASTIGHCANGLAEDLVSLCYITTIAPTIMVPAMHNTMWEHPAVQENVKRLIARGVTFVGPYNGSLADQTRGDGRMSDTPDILAAIDKVLGTAKKSSR